MNLIQNKIIFIFIIFLLSINFSLNAQDENDFKVNLFYKIYENLIFVDDASKMNYKIATYGCSDEFVKKLEKAKPSRLATGLVFEFAEYNRNSSSFGVDILIIDESKNSEIDDIYTKLLKENVAIALFTNNWYNKNKITINFVSANTGNQVNFEYYIDNIKKFNIGVNQNLHDLGGKDINANILLTQAQDKLDDIQQELVQKEIDLENTIREFETQQEKVELQKTEIFNQQKKIEKQQEEYAIQMSRFQKVNADMQITQHKLIEQEKSFIQKEYELAKQQQEIVDYQKKVDEVQARLVGQQAVIDEKINEVDEVTKQIEEKKKELGIMTDVIRLQRYALILFGLLFAIIVFLIIWVFRSYKKMKHQNEVLEHQKTEIETQTIELEKANLELEKLSIVASKTNNAVSILDENGNFDWINAGFTKLYGYTLQLIKNELNTNISEMSLYKGISEIFMQITEQKQSVSFEHESKTRDNKPMWIHSNLTPILDYKNKVKQIILIDTDISEIKQAEQQIALQNKSITKSILYASRIQKATLPTSKSLHSYLPNNFILYLPRDIVSGDFYWSHKIQDKIFISAADCTGHGVPGAFMSMLGITLLNEIISKLSYNELQPNIILNNLREKLIQALRQSEQDSATSDGIDLAFCMIEPEKKIISYSGAQNELIHIRNGKLTDYIADGMPIGVSVKNNYTSFKNTIIEYQKEDVIYMFSDGYVDQFGGPEKRRKKFMVKRLRELFLEIYDKSSEEQKSILLEKHLEWKGNNKQLDDILVMGIRL